MINDNFSVQLQVLIIKDMSLRVYEVHCHLERSDKKKLKVIRSDKTYAGVLPGDVPRLPPNRRQTNAVQVASSNPQLHSPKIINHRRPHRPQP